VVFLMMEDVDPSGPSVRFLVDGAESADLAATRASSICSTTATRTEDARAQARCEWKRAHVQGLAVTIGCRPNAATGRRRPDAAPS